MNTTGFRSALIIVCAACCAITYTATISNTVAAGGDGVAGSTPASKTQNGDRSRQALFQFGSVQPTSASFHGNERAIEALRSGQAEPRVLASGDLDGNATPDVVAGYAYRGTGIVTLQRGNPDAF